MMTANLDGETSLKTRVSASLTKQVIIIIVIMTIILILTLSLGAGCVGPELHVRGHRVRESQPQAGQLPWKADCVVLQGGG